MYKTCWNLGNKWQQDFPECENKWISMLNLNKKLMEKYKIFSMKMTIDNPTNQQANMNYEHLCDL
jgi:hypothetical protein